MKRRFFFAALAALVAFPRTLFASKKRQAVPQWSATRWISGGIYPHLTTHPHHSDFPVVDDVGPVTFGKEEGQVLLACDLETNACDLIIAFISGHWRQLWPNNPEFPCLVRHTQQSFLMTMKPPTKASLQASYKAAWERAMNSI